jgi:signal transduction histidine kinase
MPGGLLAEASRRRTQPAISKEAAFLNALTIIVHDLKGPLANLMVLVELIEACVQARAFDRVGPAAERAQGLIETLDGLLSGFLERARLTGDPLAFAPGLVDLASVVGDAISLNRPMAENRGITFDRTNAYPLTVNGDRRLLLEAVENLVSNAVKYAPSGSTVRCSVAREGRYGVVQIADEGQGIDALDAKRAFRPFTRLSTSVEPRGASWGLGLWIVRLIAERHGGKVDAISGTAPGTIFSLQLPLDLR